MQCSKLKKIRNSPYSLHAACEWTRAVQGPAVFAICSWASPRAGGLTQVDADFQLRVGVAPLSPELFGINYICICV